MEEKKIENIKTGILVVLFLSTILLSYFLWEDFRTYSFDVDKINDNHDENSIELTDLLRPQRYYINFGGGQYTVLYDDSYNIWDDMINSYIQLTDNIVSVRKIPESEWKEATNVRSIKLEFGYNVPSKMLEEVLSIDKEINDQVQYFNKVLYSSNNYNSFFIYDETNNNYYKVNFKNSYNQIFDIIDKIDNEQYDSYSKIKSIYKVNNESLISLKLRKNSNLKKINYSQEIKSYEGEKVEALASTFFGENFDFIRKVVETDTSIVYMYGYGQRVLKIGNDGVLEYKKEIDLDNIQNTSMIDALKLAINFVEGHGSWQNADGKNMYPYLKNMKPIEYEKKQGYKFEFSYHIEGLPVYYESNVGEPIEVIVVGNQVVSYKRYILNKNDNISYVTNITDKGTILSAAHILNKDAYLEMFYFKYVNENKEENKEVENNKINDKEIKNEEIQKKEVIEYIISNIKKVKLGYFKQEKNSNELVPVWIFTINNDVFYFDAYNGELLYQCTR